MIIQTSFRERIVLYALLTSLTSISIDALLPGLRQIGADVGVAPPLSTQHVISLFILGMAFGELLLGPLSDAMGRKRALVLGLGVYALGTVIAMVAKLARNGHPRPVSSGCRRLRAEDRDEGDDPRPVRG